MREIKIEIPESLIDEIGYKKKEHKWIGYEDIHNIFGFLIDTGSPCKLNVKITQEARNEKE